MTQSGPSINDPAEEKRAGQTVRQYAARAIDVLLPERCYNCGDIVGASGGLCSQCWAQITFISTPYCQRCGRPFEFSGFADMDCGACLRRPPVYDRARASMVYDAGSRGVILAFKHGDRTDMAPVLATWLRRAGRDVVERADLIVPVPLHWSRLVFRKFNQSAELARHLARQSARTYAPEVIRRRRRTLSQAGLNGKARAKNVRGAFAVPKKAAARVAGKRVLLIDDVMTTGSTLSACAGILLWAGAAGVDVLTLARVVRPESE